MGEDDEEFKDILEALERMNLRRIRQDLYRHGRSRIYTEEGAQVLVHTLKDAKEEIAARKGPPPKWKTFKIKKKEKPSGA